MVSDPSAALAYDPDGDSVQVHLLVGATREEARAAAADLARAVPCGWIAEEAPDDAA